MPELMAKYPNLPMYLADASLVVLAEEINDNRIMINHLNQCVTLTYPTFS